MGRFGTILFLIGTVVVSSKASSVWQYNIPAAYRDYGMPIGIAQRPCDHPALTIKEEPVTVEEFHPLPELPEVPKLEELSLSELMLPAAPPAPAFQEFYVPLGEIPKLPELPTFTLPEFREEEPKKEEEPSPIQLFNIPVAPSLPPFSFPASAVKVVVPEPALPVSQPPALPTFTYEVPEKHGEPAVVPCGILELPSFSPAQTIVPNPWDQLTNYAPASAPEWSAPLEEVRINEIPQSPVLPLLTLPEFHFEQPAITPEIIVAVEPEPEPVKLASIPEAPVLPLFTMPELPITMDQPAPLSEIPALPTRVVVEPAILPCQDNIFSAPAAFPALPEININTIEEAQEEKIVLVNIPAAPQLPEFSIPISIELEAEKFEPVPESPKLPELPALPFPELPVRFEAQPCDSAEPIIVEEVQLGPIPEGPVLPEFSAKVDIEEPVYYAPAPAPAPVAPAVYVPLANIPEAPKLGEINIEEVRLPEIRIPEKPIESSTPCICEKKAESAPAYFPEYPVIRLPEIDFRFNPIIAEPEQRAVVATVPEYASYYAPKYCIENIVKQRVLPNLMSGPKHEFVISIPKRPHFPTFNSLPVA